MSCVFLPRPAPQIPFKTYNDPGDPTVPPRKLFAFVKMKNSGVHTHGCSPGVAQSVQHARYILHTYAPTHTRPCSPQCVCYCIVELARIIQTRLSPKASIFSASAARQGSTGTQKHTSQHTANTNLSNPQLLMMFVRTLLGGYNTYNLSTSYKLDATSIHNFKMRCFRKQVTPLSCIIPSCYDFDTPTDASSGVIARQGHRSLSYFGSKT